MRRTRRKPRAADRRWTVPLDRWADKLRGTDMTNRIRALWRQSISVLGVTASAGTTRTGLELGAWRPRLRDGPLETSGEIATRRLRQEDRRLTGR